MKVHCYLITTPEVEGFRGEGFVLLEVESLRVQSLWLLKKIFTLKEHQFINRE